MPLDPFTSLSLAGNILQFIDFGNKVLSRGGELYKSKDGILPVNKELDQMVADLETLMGKLRKPSHLASLRGRPTESENALETICEACGNVANEIHMHLKALRVEGKHRKWQSFCQAIKTAWTADDLQALLKRLGAFQDTLQMHVLVGLRRVSISVPFLATKLTVLREEITWTRYLYSCPIDLIASTKILE
jgi:hypothetical protein